MCAMRCVKLSREWRLQKGRECKKRERENHSSGLSSTGACVRVRESSEVWVFWKNIMTMRSLFYTWFKNVIMESGDWWSEIIVAKLGTIFILCVCSLRRSALKRCVDARTNTFCPDVTLRYDTRYCFDAQLSSLFPRQMRLFVFFVVPVFFFLLFLNSLHVPATWLWKKTDLGIIWSVMERMEMDWWWWWCAQEMEQENMRTKCFVVSSFKSHFVRSKRFDIQDECTRGFLGKVNMRSKQQQSRIAFLFSSLMSLLRRSGNVKANAIRGWWVTTRTSALSKQSSNNRYICFLFF